VGRHAGSVAKLVSLVLATALTGCDAPAPASVDAARTSDGGTAASDAGARDAARSDGGGACRFVVPADTHEDDRTACTFAEGALSADTIGLGGAAALEMPIDHVVIVMQENRSFDHYFASLGHGVDPIPTDYRNLDTTGAVVRPFHLDSHCLPHDPPHQWTAMHDGWNDGAMNGFVGSAAVSGSDGHYVLGTYDETDLPFYYWLARTFAISDHYFGGSLGGTWSNRAFLYTGSSHGIHSTGETTIPDAPSVFDALDAAGVTWGVYTDGNPRQDLMGWTRSHAGVHTFTQFLVALAAGTLPEVTFVDPGPAEDEHPANDISPGEQWTRRIFEVAIASPLWPSLAMFVTYDESGGLFDHVPPPAACVPAPGLEEFDRLGVRIPVYLVSPWARPGYVSHVPHSHTSILRFVELRFGLPALSARDANSDAMLDLFDFCTPSFETVPDAPAAGEATCG
jgi:phospholipase C